MNEPQIAPQKESTAHHKSQWFFSTTHPAKANRPNAVMTWMNALCDKNARSRGRSAATNRFQADIGVAIAIKCEENA